MFLQPVRRRSLPARIYPLPPPIGGINALDAITDMPESDALLLDNIVCQPDYVELRKGFETHATGMSGAINSVFSWHGTASQKMKAATSTAIYDVSASGAVGAAEVSSLTNGKWQTVMMANAGANYLMICNGADAVRHYDGTTWATPTINNVSSATLCNIALHQRRVWFVEEDSTSGWYLAVDAIAGDATEFDFGPRFPLGGKLVAIGSMTRDGGDGPDDYLVAVSSRGEIAIYTGTDPATASTWASLGTFYTAPPIGKRCVEKMGGDLAITTKSGVMSCMSLLRLDRAAQQKAAVTSKIQRLFANDSASYSGNFGWQVLSHPAEEMFLVNVPSSEGSTSHQYSMSALTGSWSRFTGINPTCMTTFNDELYGGGTAGTVLKMNTGYQDNGGGITADIKTAFSRFNSPQRKRFLQLRPQFASTGSPGFLMGLNVDFGDQAPTSSPSTSPLSGALWGAAIWGTDTWAQGESGVIGDWQGVGNIGTTAAVRMRIVSDGATCKLYGFESMYEIGGFQ